MSLFPPFQIRDIRLDNGIAHYSFRLQRVWTKIALSTEMSVLSNLLYFLYSVYRYRLIQNLLQFSINFFAMNI